MTKQQEIVLSYKKLKDRIRSKEDEKKVLKHLMEIRAEYSESYIKTLSRFLDSTLPRLYDGFNFNENGINLKEYAKDNAVVLVPNHQSHADYVAIGYMVYKKYKMPLYVAGGNNLNIFPIGKMFRKSGCFFIRRSFQNDILYKLTLEAYLYYLLSTGKPIEFFFEGGRSRTGRLLSPRFGLYQMLLEAYSQLKEDGFEKELIFLPVSVAHENVPEQRSLVSELKGAKKSKESTGQLFGLVKLFSYQFGNIHIQIGNGVKPDFSVVDQKRRLQNLAFECFREVGKNMMVTPTSLLALVLLDEPTGALKWDDILAKARGIRNFCQEFNIPFTQSLDEQNFKESLERTIDILIGNKKVEVIGKGSQGHVFYTIKSDARAELLYFKNTILHHFIVAGIINSAWIRIFKGKISTVSDLKEFFVGQRDMLKHEFYLPTVKDMFQQATEVISKSVNRQVQTLEECLDMSHRDLYLIAKKISYFSRAFNFITESYYITSLSLKTVFELSPKGFKIEAIIKTCREVFENEKALGKIRYPEAFSIPMIRSSAKHFVNLNQLENVDGLYRIVDLEKFEKLISVYEEQIKDSLSFNIQSV
ncbi:MAG: 1-acyl-sn-glycerol-3-phosphate acyltransferase [Bacteriovoracaceae bacterium]